MAYDKHKMQDIKYSEKELIQQYITYWNNKDISGMNQFLAAHPNLKYKILNSENWNRLLNLVNDATQSSLATDDSLVGKWENDYHELETASEDFTYRGIWATGNNYYKNNLVKTDNYHSYFCIQSNTSTSSNAPPNSQYWVLAEGIAGHLGIPVTQTPPSDMIVGDIYFEVEE